MSYDVGDVPQVSVAWTDLAGAAVNATTALTVTAPDGTISTPAVVAGVTGLYTGSFPVTQPGTWVYRFAASGAITAVEQGQLDVRQPGPRIVSLAQVKKQLNITGTADDDELSDYVDAATDVVEDITGPMTLQTFTQTIHADGATFTLPNLPVVAITAIVSAQAGYGWTIPLISDLTVEPWTGRVYRSVIGSAFWGPLKVTYTAGRGTVPAAVNVAARIIVAHLWRTQHNVTSGRPGFDDQPQPGMAYAIPSRAVELLEPFRQPPFIA